MRWNNEGKKRSSEAAGKRDLLLLGSSIDEDVCDEEMEPRFINSRASSPCEASQSPKNKHPTEEKSVVLGVDL